MSAVLSTAAGCAQDRPATLPAPEAPQAPDRAARQAAALVLGPEMTIAHAAALRATLLDGLAGCEGDLLLDLGGVSDFDSAGVQLLLSARLSQRSRGRALRLVASSPAVRDALLTFGLAELLAPARAD